MVHPEEVEQPSTLPADFGEWDSGGQPPATQPGDFEGFDAVPKPPAKSTTARVVVPPPAARPVSAPPRPPSKPYAPVEQRVVEQRPSKVSRVREPEPELEDEDEVATGGKSKGMIFAIVGVVVLLAAGAVGYLKFGRTPAATNPNVASQVASPGTTTAMSVPKPSASTPSDQQATAPTSTVADTSSSTSSDQESAALRAQADKMNHQLNAPSRLPGDLKMLAGKDVAPTSGFGAAGADMGSSSNVFGSQSGPKVKVAAPQKVNISAGIAVGLLVQRTAPVYPPIARTARVSGTVVIQATISKAGQIVNSRVVSGPTMLRQAALDAVKTWRFRPYLLDGEPVEVETTVNVVFNLGQ